MRKVIFFLVAALVSVSLGCYVKTEHKITAHITIDVRQVKDAASSIEDMVAGTSPSSSSIRSFPLSFLISDAHAQSTRLKYMTDEIKTAVERRRERNPRIEDLLSRGILGEDNKGLLAIRSKSKDFSEDEVKDIVTEENADRMLIYRSIQEQNELPSEALPRIQSIFAEERHGRVKEEVWIQLSNGDWIKK